MVRLGKNARSGAHSRFDSFIRGQRNSWDQQQRWQGLVIYNTIKEPRWRLSMWEGVWSLGLGLGSPSRKEAVRLPLWTTTKGTVMAATTGKSLSFSFVCVSSDVERMRSEKEWASIVFLLFVAEPLRNCCFLLSEQFKRTCRVLLEQLRFQNFLSNFIFNFSSWTRPY